MESLADKVRRRLDAGELPREHSDNVAAGNGNGETCSGCNEIISHAHVMNEMDESEQTYRFHTGCYGLWLGELIRRGRYTPG